MLYSGLQHAAGVTEQLSQEACDSGKYSVRAILEALDLLSNTSGVQTASISGAVSQTMLEHASGGTFVDTEHTLPRKEGCRE